MKRVVVILLFIMVGLFGYFMIYGYSFQVREAQLQEKINAKLPFSKPYYLMFRATLDHAELKLLDGEVHITFDAHLDTLNPMLLMNRNAVHAVLPLLSGSADIIATPEYNFDTGQVFLSQVNVVSMDIKGVQNGSAFKSSVRKLALAYLAKHPVYTLHGNNLKMMLARNWLKEVGVKQHALELMFGI